MFGIYENFLVSKLKPNCENCAKKFTDVTPELLDQFWQSWSSFKGIKKS